ncbi:hypothetical protein B0H17DRAFT_1196245 [Mycena rosella]|uniref:Non-ribosomal peptide synthetase n=1 Tax=Mycena rosella TaxID=1033263 RepID=A0AAD7DUU8_MYCRO|nr:hypothetical protein B0H17DRAFT_1196245 [Mycena rosella]
MPSFSHDAEKGLHAQSLVALNAFPSRSPPDSTASTPPLSKDVPPLAFASKSKRKTSRIIKFQLWFNAYRKLFCISFAFNVVGLVLAASGHWEYPKRYPGAFVHGNLLAAILMRNEFFGRFLYLIVNTLFAKWPPLWFRLACTSTLQHLGGIHSGCATSGAMWLVYCVVLIIVDYRHYPLSIITAGVVTSVAVFISIASDFPWLREYHHNIFYHRLVGWFCLLSTWVFVVLGESYDITTHSWNPDGVIRQQDFWFAMGMSVCIFIPWITLRKVPVVVEVPSPKVAVIRFERGMQQGLLTRISRGSILEYHAFGIISMGRQSQEHYLICGVQGDFAQSLVDNPPSHLWTRQLKFAGVSNTSKLYKRGIRVCTGTGLGAALSTCLQSPDWYLIWIGSDQAKTFGPTISSLIRNNLPPEQYTLWDSKERGGRPDVMKLIKEVYSSWGAEVVFITSNLGGSTEMMQGCKKEGIPAFGTLWDF